MCVDCAEKTSALPKNYKDLSEGQKIAALLTIDAKFDSSLIENELDKDTLETIAAIRTIQKINGPDGCHRYIISHSTSALNIMEVYGLFLLSGWKKEKLSMDIVPLFESIDDLQNAGDVMKSLYENDTYRKHLKQRNNIQTIMLGFSDGTEDGGYLMANWSIYKAKEKMTTFFREYGVEVVFFDGRGGPREAGERYTSFMLPWDVILQIKKYSSLNRDKRSALISLPSMQCNTIGTADECRDQQHFVFFT